MAGSGNLAQGYWSNPVWTLGPSVFLGKRLFGHLTQSEKVVPENGPNEHFCSKYVYEWNFGPTFNYFFSVEI